MKSGNPEKRKVLVIDDDEDYCQQLRILLEKEGFDVRCSPTGAEGLKQAISSPPDIIILDVMMEDNWAGYEVNQAIKFKSGYENIRDVPVIMVSSIEQRPSERFLRAADAGMVSPDAYLTKPLESKKFMETVRSLLKTTTP